MYSSNEFECSAVCEEILFQVVSEFEVLRQVMTHMLPWVLMTKTRAASVKNILSEHKLIIQVRLCNLKSDDIYAKCIVPTKSDYHHPQRVL